PPRSTPLDALSLLHSSTETASLIPFEPLIKALTTHFQLFQNHQNTLQNAAHLLIRLLAASVVFLDGFDSDYAMHVFNLRFVSTAAAAGSTTNDSEYWKYAIPKPLSRFQKGCYALWTVVGEAGWMWLKDRLVLSIARSEGQNYDGFDDEDEDGEGSGNFEESEARSALLSSRLNNLKWKKRLLNILNFVENVLAIASVVNFVIYLRFGRHRTLVERILKMAIIPRDRVLPVATASFDHMNRELVKFNSIVGSSKRAVGARLKTFIALAAAGSSGTDENSERVDQIPLYFDDPACPICVDAGRWADVVNVCGDGDGPTGARITAVSPACTCFQYCYYCLRWSFHISAALLADKEFSCAKCGLGVGKCVRC
ncbi:hypothetical protein BDR26DRAFT_874454, partial [Obelidium mucronatum]